MAEHSRVARSARLRGAPVHAACLDPSAEPRRVPGTIVGLVLLIVLCTTGKVNAGDQPTLRAANFDFQQIAVLAKGLERTLAAKRARVALIARVGLNPEVLPPGVTFSHAGFAVYSKIETSDGRLVPGYAVYNLYQGAERSGVSFLAQDYPVDYLAVSQTLKVGVVIPNEKLQRALARTIFSDTYHTLHNPRYSVLSNPLNSQFQNCTEFVLDVIFAAIYTSGEPRRLKANIAAYFEPHPILVDSMKLNMAARTMPDVTIQDHSETVATATFSSIARFLLRQGIAEEAFSFTVDPTTLYGRMEQLEI